MKQLYITLVSCLFICSVHIYAQVGNIPKEIGGMVIGDSQARTIDTVKINDKGEYAERLWYTCEAQWENNVEQTVKADKQDFELFLEYNAPVYYKDKGTFFTQAMQGYISSYTEATRYFADITGKYVSLYKDFLRIKADYPSAITEQINSLNKPPLNIPAACNPSCDNISFQNGTLSAWSAYYAVNSSSTSAITISTPTGGACGAVTQAGGADANTGSDYQVTLMTAGGTDPVAGSLIPLTPPLGGICARIGDGTTTGAGVGILQQTYVVSASNPVLTLQYAVVLENPGHPPTQQPFFQMQVLDQNGNEIAGCGQYQVTSSSGLPGFKGIYYAPDGDTCYCEPWTTVFVPLYNYIGQCVTVKFEAADCSLGGHFGYAYVAATCSTLSLVTSSKIFCKGQKSATITAPPGGTSYKWSTINGCISGPATQQTLTVTCAGTYSVIITPSSGAACVDTLNITIPASNAGPPPISCFIADEVCSGTQTTFNAACSNGGTKYYWDFYDNGVIEDSTNATTATWIYGGGGFYQVKLEVENAAGCSSDTVIKIAVDSSALNNFPNVTTTVTNATSCSVCNGSVDVFFSGSGLSSTATYTIKDNFNNTVATVTNGAVTGVTTNSLNSSTNNGVLSLSFNYTMTGLCQGTYYLYVNSSVATKPTKCNPKATTGDTIAFTINSNGVNINNNFTTLPAICGKNNGIASVTGIGGTSPYTYKWSTGATTSSITGLSAGIYSVTTTDANGCKEISTVKILSVTGLPATVTPYYVTCFGLNNGSIKVTPGGGTAPYTYTWTPAITTTDSAGGLSAGTYVILVTDANGCSGTFTETIIQPTQLIATISASTNATCSTMGSAIVNATGGTPAYIYSWSTIPTQTQTTATGLSAGIYSVTVTDGSGCSAVATVTITTTCGPTVSIIGGSICLGECYTFTPIVIGGTAPYSYSWSPGGATNSNLAACPLTTTSYTLSVTDNNNKIATASTTVTIYPTTTITTKGINVLCFGTSTGSATASATGGAAPYTYAWSTAPAQTTNSATGLSAGTYTIETTDAHGCTTTTSVIITQPTPIGATTTSVDAFCGLNNGSATASATGGTPPYTYSWNKGQATVTATGLSAGTFTVTVTDNNGCTTTAAANVIETSSITLTVDMSVNVFCNGGNNGSVTSTVTGGTTPYTYSWNPTGQTTTNATGLTAGTYTITVKDVNGCIETTTTIITQPLLLTTTMAPPTNIPCNGGNNGSAIATTTGGTLPYTYSWSPSGGNASIATGLTAGTYTVTVTDNNGCKSTATTIITQPVILSVTIGVPTNVLCNGGNNGSTTATAKGGVLPYTYLWAISGGTNATATGLIAGTYTVNVTDANACTNSATVTITQPTPFSTTTSFTPAFCNLNNGSATVNVTGGTSPYTYSWTPVGGNNATIIGVKAGTYTVLVTDNNGCTITSPVTITQPPAVTASIGHITEVSCFGGNNGSIAAIATGGPSPYTYSWNPTAQNTSTASALTAGTYTVTIADSNGCISTTTAIIIQPTLVTVTITTTTNVLCNGGNNGSATSAVTGGTSPYKYAWSPIGGTNATGTGLTAGNYTITVTDAHGCVATTTTTINQPLALATTTSFVAAYCNLPNGSATVNVINGTSPYTYLWNPSGQTTSTATGLAVGTYTVGVIDNNGCKTSNTVTVTQPSAVVASILNTTPVSCFDGNNGTATATANGGTSPYTYVWSAGAQSNSTATGLSAGTYTVVVRDNSGCLSSATAIIIQPTLLTINLNGPPSLCDGATGILTAYASGGTAPYNYVWSNGSSTSTASVTPTSATTYTATVTDANGCTASAKITVLIGAQLFVTTNGQASVCSGTSVRLCANPSGGTGGNLFTWQPGNYSTPCITVTPSVTTTYTVSVTDNCGATATASATIQVNPLPFVDFAADLYTGCIPLCIQFYNNSSVSGQSSYSWSFGNGDTALKTNHPIYCYPDSGLYTVILTVTSDSGCSATRKKTNYIHALGLPKAAFSFSPQPAYIISPTIQFTDQTTDPNGGISYWTWTYGDKLDSVGTTQNTVHTYPDTGTYCAKLAVMDHKGCTDTITNCLVIDPIFTLYIPNAFTPNADGMDDIFLAKGVYVKDFEMYIFDRWGEQLYHTNDINKGWNGTIKGGTNISQEDVYVYKILATDWQNHQHSYIGSVTLIK